jgi:hypothetical protein
MYTGGDGTTGLAFTPRAGVELFRHVRFTLSGAFVRKGFNNACLSLGIVIGGGKKKM